MKTINHSEVKRLLYHQEELPARGYTTLPSDPTEVIIVVKGETGYYHYQKYETEEDAEMTARFWNEQFNASPEAVEALMILSMRSKK